LYAVSVVADALSHSQQPLVPETMLSAGGEGTQGGMLGILMSLLVAEKIGIKVGSQTKPEATATIEEGMKDGGSK
jgi:hypothetical protein